MIPTTWIDLVLFFLGGEPILVWWYEKVHKKNYSQGLLLLMICYVLVLIDSFRIFSPAYFAVTQAIILSYNCCSPSERILRKIGNSDVWQTLAARALRCREECGRLWVQCRPHTRPCNIFNIYSFLSVASSIVVSYTYHFTVDDDHLHKSRIPSSVIRL